MSSEWRVVTIEEIAAPYPTAMATGPFGSAISAKYFVDSGVPVIRGSNLSADVSTRLIDDGLVFVSAEKAKEFQRSVVKRGDLVFTCWGTINQVGLIDAHSRFERYVISNKQMKLSVDPDKADHRFVYYVFSGPDKQAEILDNGIGSSVPGFNLGQLKRHEILLPPLKEQVEIADFLAMLDDRITLLRETNATLEAIAQALFKSWFVDFDPVRAKMEGRTPEGMDEATAALFPDGFETSELGEVPRGWRVATLGEICSVTIGGLWGSDERDTAELTAAISLRGVDLEHLRVEGFAVNAPKRWVKQSAMEKRRLSESEVLVASSGAGPCGRTLWAGAGFETFYGMPVIYSNFVKRLDCGSPARAIFIDRLLAEMRETREIWNYINGTSIPNLDDKLLLATKKVLVPDNRVLSAFESIARTIYERLYSQQAQTLSTLRDTLLPRLISGQLRLPEAENLVKALIF